MSQLMLVYWISAGLGFLYIVGSAAMGHLHGSEDVEGDTSGDPGDVDADGGDPGDVNADGGDPGDVNADGQHHQHALAATQAGAMARRQKQRNLKNELYFKVLGVLSPTKLTIFLFFFGATGIVIMQFFPMLGQFSLIPSAIIGYLIGQLLLNSLSKMVSGLHSSTNFKQESLIGSVGDLILSIEPGSLGEIVISTKGARHHAPARAKDPNLAIKQFSKVIICDHKDGVFLIEPVVDENQ